MSSTTATFFAEERFPNSMKHAIVGSYVREALRVLMAKYKTDVVYADLFAGEGRYGDGRPGSPLLVAEMAAARYTAKETPLVRCFNVEADKTRFDRLVANTAEIPPEVITNKPGAWDDHVPDLLKRIANRPSIIFLDPFGFRGIELEKMTQILAGIGADAWELIITFNLRGLQRMVAAASADERRGRPHRYYELPDAVFGGDEWRSEIVDGALPDASLEKLAALYQRRLLKAGGQPFLSRYVVSVPIPEHLDGRPAYFLVFVSRSERAMVMINDIMNLEFERARYEVEAADAKGVHQVELIPGLLEHPPTVAELEAAMLPRLRALVLSHFEEAPRQISFADLHAKMVQTNLFGEFREKHVRAVVKELREGVVLETDPRAVSKDTVIRPATRGTAKVA